MAGPFPLLTDEHISKALIKTLRDRGWDVVRAVDVFGQRTDDQILFEYAAEKGRVLVTTDAGLEASRSAGCVNGAPFPASSSGPRSISA